MREAFWVITLLIACCFASDQAYAGAESQKQVSLDLGSITVWLGMPKEVARKKIADAHYKISYEDAYSMIIGSGDYQVGFKAGRLCFASRSWLRMDKIDAVIGALGAAAGDGEGSTCIVSHQPTSDPMHSTNRIFVQCGKRSVLIMKVKFNGNDETDEVSERIGELPAEALK